MFSEGADYWDTQLQNWVAISEKTLSLIGLLGHTDGLAREELSRSRSRACNMCGVLMSCKCDVITLMMSCGNALVLGETIW